MGTNLPGITALVAPGGATPGNGTLVGPAYKSDYLTTTPKFDVAGAKALLAQAGYPNGTSLSVVTQTIDPIPAVVTAWQAQMKAIGVNVNIQQVPPSVYYADKGKDTWYQAPFGVVDWGTRAAPVTYFQLSLTSTAPWNYSRWKDPQFDSVVAQIVAQLDPTKRAALYQQAQQILQQQVPHDQLHRARGDRRTGQEPRRHHARPGLVADPPGQRALHAVSGSRPASS